MELMELEQYLSVSRSHSVIIDVCEIPEAPGNLRSITIHQDNRVTIEFQKCSEYLEGSIEGGGLKYIGRYDTLSSLIEDLEKYLNSPIRGWKNYSRASFQPQVTEESSPAENQSYFERLVRQHRIALPEHGKYEIGGIYWKHIQLFGQFVPDRLGKEDEWLMPKGEGSREDDCPDPK